VLATNQPTSEAATDADEQADEVELSDEQIAQVLATADTAGDSAEVAPAAFTDHRLKLAIVGRPNVGKSTLINTLLGEERVIAFGLPGTTRDAIELECEGNGRLYTLIDTAGLPKRGKVFESIEKFSVIKTLQPIEASNVVVLMLDAQSEISEQDAH